jgi:SAM-dependent methyltransferase
MGAMKYIGHDISDQFIKVARDLGLHVVHSRATKLHAPDSSCDFVWAFDTLEHIHPDERNKTYSEIGRVIKKGGIVVVNSPLMVSFHEDYDYGFDEKDAEKLMEIAELRRVKRKVITYNELDDSMRAYMYEEFESCK